MLLDLLSFTIGRWKEKYLNKLSVRNDRPWHTKNDSQMSVLVKFFYCCLVARATQEATINCQFFSFIQKTTREINTFLPQYTQQIKNAKKNPIKSLIEQYFWHKRLVHAKKIIKTKLRNCIPHFTQNLMKKLA